MEGGDGRFENEVIIVKMRKDESGENNEGV